MAIVHAYARAALQINQLGKGWFLFGLLIFEWRAAQATVGRGQALEHGLRRLVIGPLPAFGAPFSVVCSARSSGTISLIRPTPVCVRVVSPRSPASCLHHSSLASDMPAFGERK